MYLLVVIFCCCNARCKNYNNAWNAYLYVMWTFWWHTSGMMIMMCPKMMGNRVITARVDICNGTKMCEKCKRSTNGGDWTRDHTVKSRALYLLSYIGCSYWTAANHNIQMRFWKMNTVIQVFIQRYHWRMHLTLIIQNIIDSIKHHVLLGYILYFSSQFVLDKVPLDTTDFLLFLVLFDFFKTLHMFHSICILFFSFGNSYN